MLLGVWYVSDPNQALPWRERASWWLPSHIGDGLLGVGAKRVLIMTPRRRLEAWKRAYSCATIRYTLG